MSDITPVNPVPSGLPARLPSRPPGYPAAPGKPRNDGISPIFVLHAMRRWWKVAAPIGILLAVASAGLVFFFFKKSYVAVGRIRILEQQPHIAFPVNESANKKFVQTQLQILKLDEVLRPVQNEPEIRRHPAILTEKYPLEYLRKTISVKAEGDSEIYSITYQSEDPVHAAQVVNSVINSYMKFVTSFEAQLRQTLMQSLDREIKKWESTVKQLSSKLQELCETKGVRPTPVSLGIASSSSDDAALSMEALLVQSEVDLVLLNAEIESEQKMSDAPPDSSQRNIDRAVATELFDHKLDLEVKDRQLKKLASAQSAKSNPLYQQELARYKADQETYLQLEERLRNDHKSQLALTTDSRIEDLRWKLATAQATKKIVEERLKKVLADNKVVIGDQVEVDFANRELLQAESTYKLLVEQKARVSTEENAPSRVMTISGPGGVPVPTMPMKPLPLMEILLAIGVSLAAPFGLAVGWEWIVKRVNGVSDLRQQMGMPILGEIAVLPSYSSSSGRRISRKAHLGRQLFQESVDGLRTTLMLANSMQSVQILAVASAVSGEGKTSVATHLAMSLAHTTGKPILLIDGDLRAPDVHHVFDVERGPGLAEVLTGEAPLEKALAPSGFAQLDVLPAGELTTNPHRLLHNGELRALLDRVRDKYAYILIDMPPVLAASESLVLANQADGTVLCVLRDRTRLSNLKEAQSRLADAGAKTLGIVMSGLPARHYSSRYGSYSYSTTPD